MTQEDMLKYVEGCLREARQLLTEAQSRLAEAERLRAQAIDGGDGDLAALERRFRASQREEGKCQREVNRLVWAHRYCQMEADH